MNKKLIDSSLNCEDYTTFEGISSDHRIITAKTRLTLRSNKKQIHKITR